MVKGSLPMAASNDFGYLISVISFGIVFPMRMARVESKISILECVIVI